MDNKDNKENKEIKKVKPSIDKGEIQNSETIYETTEELAVMEQHELPATSNVPPPKMLNTTINSLNTQEKLLSFANLLVKGKMCSFKEPADAVVGLITGQELGLGLAAILGGVYVIEGRPSLGVHVKKAILLNKNVLFKRTRDMEVYYQFVEIIDDKPVDMGQGYLDQQPPNTKKKAIDTRTEYLFTRYFNTPRGIVMNTAIGMFSIAEATQAGLMDKGTWQKYTRDLLSSRAFSRGANEIADDLLNGMLSFSELADINDGVTYYIDKNGHEQIVK